MQLHEIHHLTAVSADARGNRDFYTRVLGMRLVKRTVNQDDVGACHLFYADGMASPGSDLTFFGFPAAPGRRGTRSIVRTALRVAGSDTLAYWIGRLSEAGVRHGAIETVDRSTASISAASTRARRVGSSTRSQATDPASPPTSRSRHWASACRCRHSWRPGARKSSGT